MRLRVRNLGRWAVALFAVTLNGVAAAHPLGNFSINQYFLLDLREPRPQLYYLLDMAEIPSFSELDLLDNDFDSEITDAEREAYLEMKVAALAANLALEVDGQSVDLVVADQQLALLEGLGGMAIFNVIVKLTPKQWAWPADDAPRLYEVQSENYTRDNGVRELKLILDGAWRDATAQLDAQEQGYQTLVYLDEQGNPVYQDVDPQFRVQLAAGKGPIPPEPTKLTFGWTATARLAVTENEQPFLEGMAEIRLAETADADLPENLALADAGEVFDEDVTAGQLTARYTKENAQSESGSALMSRVADIIQTEKLSPWMLAIALVIAAALGMGHAFSPGHGKTVMAAYLIGERGTIRHAFILGTVVTITHVWSVLALGVVTLYAGERFSETQLSFWTGIASGVIIVIIGAMLFFRRYKAYVLSRQGVPVVPEDYERLAHGHDHGNGGHVHDHDHGPHDHDHDHDHAHAHAHDHHHDHDHAHAHDHHHDHDHEHPHHHHHDHDHDHGHDHGHHSHGLFSHTHVVETKDGTPPTYGSIFWLGISGGIVPCPAALIVLLLAIRMERLSLGLLLIVAFSFGLAAVLVALGIAVVRASGEVRRRIGERSPLLLALPVVSSVLITVLGLWVVLWTLIEYNVVIIRPV